MTKETNTKIVKNRFLTERKLIDAVGTIIRTKGYKGLGVNAIAKEAEVNKKLIYRYFDNVDRLIETYVIEKDYWLSFNEKISKELNLTNPQDDMINMIASLLEKQMEFFYTEDEMQRIILWEISEKTNILDSVCKVREEYGNAVLAMTDSFFKKSDVHLGGVTALIVAGIYYLVLHAKKNESTICGIDTNSIEGRKILMKTIRQIIEWSFRAAAETTPPESSVA